MATISSAERASDRSFARIAQGAEKAERAVDRSMKRQAASAGVASTAMRSFSTAFVGSLSVAAVAAAIKSATDFASEIGRTAKELDISTEALQTWRYAASQNGVTAAELDAAMQGLNQSIGKAATGSVKDQKALLALGFSMKEIKAGTIDTNDGLRATANFLAKIPEPARRAAVETALMGEAGKKLDGMLSGGAGAIDKLAQAAKRLGYVLSDDDIRNADETARKLADVKTVLAHDIASAVGKNSQAIIAFAQAIGALSGKILQLWNTNPQGLFTLLGAGAGLFTAGPYGALVGGTAGFVYSGYAQRQAQESNTDVQFRIDQVRATQAKRRDFQERGLDTRTLDEELKKQIQMLRWATAKAKGDRAKAAYAAESAGSGGLNANQDEWLKSLNAPAERKRSQDNKWKDALRDQHRHDMDIARAQLEELRAREDLAVETEDKASLALQQLDLEREIERKTSKFNVDMGDITDKQAEELAVIADQVLERRKQLVTLGASEDVQKEKLKLEQEASQLRLNALELEMADARTAAEQRAIARQIMDERLRMERRNLQFVIDSGSATADEKQAAERSKLFLERRETQMQRQSDRQHMGPLEAYLDEIPRTAEDINQALENIAVSGLRDVEDGFARAATKALGLKGAIGSIVQELIKLALKKQVIDALFGLIGLGKKTGSPGGTDGARAFGGPVSAGRSYLVGENGPEILRMGNQAGVVIPNHQIAAQGRSTTIIQHFTLDARGGITTPQLLAQVNNTITQAGTAAAMAGGADGERRVMRRATRRIPG